VAHAQKVRLIVTSRRKDDRLDARTLARLARIDPELLSPVQHRSAQAQLHLKEIRARTALVSTRTALVNAARGLVKSYDGQHIGRGNQASYARHPTVAIAASTATYAAFKRKQKALDWSFHIR
jgi:transposase